MRSQILDEHITAPYENAYGLVIWRPGPPGGFRFFRVKSPVMR